jgi:hypothetical protein
MNTDIVSIDAIVMEEVLEKNVALVADEEETLPPEISLLLTRRFGITDLWKIRNSKRHFSIYR